MARTRRTFVSEFKTDVVLQLISGQKSLAEICQEYRLNQQMVSRWKTEFLQNKSSIFDRKMRYSEGQQRIAKLERVSGCKTI